METGFFLIIVGLIITTLSMVFSAIAGSQTRKVGSIESGGHGLFKVFVFSTMSGVVIALFGLFKLIFSAFELFITLTK